MTDLNIRATLPRTTAQIKFSDGQILDGPLGSTIEDFTKSADFKSTLMPMACLVEGELRELTYPVQRDLEVKILTLANGDGRRVYRRSLSLLLVAAAHDLFPEADILINYGLNFGALYCEVKGRPPFNQMELKQLEAAMRELVIADLPIHKEQILLSEAKTLLQKMADKQRLLNNRQKAYLTVYAFNNHRDYMYGYMLPSTGYLQLFALDRYSNGFVLRYPNRDSPTELQPTVTYPMLVKVYHEYGDWMDKLGVRDVGALNQTILQGDLLQTILVAEALQEQRLAQIATLLTSLQPLMRLVLISGPSSSGKTTFSKRLAIQLLAHGLKPLILGLDDFLVEREKTPRDADGDYDFESIHAQDLGLFNDTLIHLMRGDKVTLPRYNFMNGKREHGETGSISPEHIIIVEGIHGMNPELVPSILPDNIFRIYVSALTQLNLDRHNRVATTDTRLLRRIVRDAQHRGYSATDTINRWPKVRQGEHQWIFPYQENADIMFNSALTYELAVLKPLAEPLLRQVEPGTEAHVEVKRLLSFLQWFVMCPADLVPPNSLLREFIGGSVLSNYKAGLK